MAATAVFGIYRTRPDAERGVDSLRSAGFHHKDISVLFPEGDQSKEFAHEKGTKAPEGAATGAGTGAVIGGTLGWLAGIGSLAIPGLGPFIAAGPIMAALAGAGVGGMVGGIAGALIGMGIPEYEAKRYESRVKEGGILLSVHCETSDLKARAKDVLERTGAEDIASSGEASGDTDEARRTTRTSRLTEAGPTSYAQPVGTGARVTSSEPVGAGTRMAGGTSGLGDWSTSAAECRRDYDTRYATSGASWTSMEPAYQYGHRMASDPRYRGKSWSEVEGDIRTSYLRDHPDSRWESVKDAVRYSWERVTGRTGR